MMKQTDNTVTAMHGVPSPAEVMVPGQMWVVRGGVLHLFLARVNAEGEMLARHPLCQLDAEDVLFSLHASLPDGWAVVAVGTTETRVERIALQEDAAWIAERAADWLARLRKAAGLAESPEDAAEFAWERMLAAQQEIFTAVIALQQQREAAERARIGKRHVDEPAAY